MRIHFLGGVETVTGSQHLIEVGGRRVLRDCGLFHGEPKIRAALAQALRALQAAPVLEPQTGETVEL
jgi:metallo-beta-lactamase family protein